jgi:hypothetical protein
MGQLKEKTELNSLEANEKNIFWVDQWISGAEGAAGTYSSKRIKESTLKQIMSVGLQAELISGANIKTVNGDSLLGSGNIVTSNIANQDQVISDNVRSIKTVGTAAANKVQFINGDDNWIAEFLSSRQMKLFGSLTIGDGTTSYGKQIDFPQGSGTHSIQAYNNLLDYRSVAYHRFYSNSNLVASFFDSQMNWYRNDVYGNAASTHFYNLGGSTSSDKRVWRNSANDELLALWGDKRVQMNGHRSIEDYEYDGTVTASNKMKSINLTMPTTNKTAMEIVASEWTDAGSAQHLLELDHGGNRTYRDFAMLIKNGHLCVKANDGVAELFSAKCHNDTVYFNVSNINVNGSNGFSGTGAYTNFTIVNGIITNAS